MGKGWRVMQAFGCGLTCFPMFHVKHRKNTQLYRKVFRSEALFPKMFHVKHFPVKCRRKISHYQRHIKSYLGIPSSKNSLRKNVSRGTIYYPSLSVMKAAPANSPGKRSLSPIFSTTSDKTPCGTLTPHPKSSFSSVFRRVFA